MNNIKDAIYVPILSVRPAEVRALSHLADKDKARLLPAIQLSPWSTSKKFESTLSKIQEVFGNNRQYIANIDYDYPPKENKRPAVQFFNELKNPQNGYENWCNLIQNNKNLIPCIQTEHIEQFDSQLDRLKKLERGLVLHLDARSGTNDLQSIVEMKIGNIQKCHPSNDVLFIFDFGDLSKTRADFNTLIIQQNRAMQIIIDQFPECRVAFSGTSFPHQFGFGSTLCDIKERVLYDLGRATFEKADIVYSDRGGTKLRQEREGGNRTYPRIDYPVSTKWHFYKANKYGSEEYKPMAQEVAKHHDLDSHLKIWGVQMIKNTADGISTAHGTYNIINTHPGSIAVRINIHLWQQLHQQLSSPDTDDDDDDWQD